MLSLIEATKYRISRRSYDGRPLTTEDEKVLMEVIEKLNNESGLCMKLCVGEKKAFSELRKTYGMFSGVSNYIILAGKDDTDTAEKLGYYGEKAALTAVAMGLGTCFVGATFDKDVVHKELPPDMRMYGVISIGYVSAESAKEKLLRSAIRIGKRTAKDIVFMSSDAPEWFHKGIECALSAPSARNKFPTKFTWDSEKVTASVDGEYMYRRMDLGIAKLHFELGAVGMWEFGNGGRFFKKG